MTYKGVIIDIDGTLVAPNAPHTSVVSVRLKRVIAEAQKKEVVISLATARSLHKVEGFISSLELVSPVILENGALIYDPGKKTYVFASYLSGANIQDVLSVLIRFSHKIELMSDDVRVEYDKTSKRAFEKVTKIMVVHISPRDARAIYDSLQGITSVHATISISGEDPRLDSIHVTSKDATKDKALLYVSSLVGLAPSDFIGIGDSYNDMSFLRLCGLKVAMSNSVPEILAMADYIAPHYKEDGVADVLEKFILQSV